MTRRCSHCSHNGHNSRTCPNRGVKIFGVRLTDGSAIRKSASMGNLSLLSAGSTSGGASPADGPDLADGGGGYASDDFVQGSSSASRERKKGELPPDLYPFPLIDHPTRYQLMWNPRCQILPVPTSSNLLHSLPVSGYIFFFPNMYLALTDLVLCKLGKWMLCMVQFLTG